MLSSLALLGLVASTSALPNPALRFLKRDNVTSDPYAPSGGVNVSLDIKPDYNAHTTSFDFQSINLALNQEWIELDLFNYGLRTFSAAEFEAYGIGQQERHLIQFFADQETGHARLLGNMLGGAAALSCQYNYSSAFSDVAGFISFSQQLTRWGESGVYGFLGHLNDQSAASLLLSSIVTEARQQFGFRALQGLQPITEYFVPGIPQAWAWTLLQPYIQSCPDHNSHIQFQVFPQLRVNSPNLTQAATSFKASLGGTKFSSEPSPAGRRVELNWDAPGRVVGYNRSQSLYKTDLHKGIGQASHLAWLSHINLTYTPLEGLSKNENGTYSAYTYVPEFLNLFPNDSSAPVQVNQNVLAGTIYVAVTDSNTTFTPYNLTGINAHILGGPSIYQFN